MASGIYKITNTVNQKVYIGSAVDLERREKEHFSGRQTNKILKRAMKKYGKDKFVFEVLEECTTREMLSLEQLNIDLHRVVKGWENLYNICEIAGSSLGVKHTEEAKKNMSEAHKGKCVGVKNPMYGRTGEKNPFYGKQHSEETRKLISDAHKGKQLSKETKRKIAEATKEALSDPAIRKKMSEAAKGKNNPSYNPIVYRFLHKDGRTFTGTQYELRKEYKLNSSCLSAVIHGKRNSIKGWSVIPPEDA
jgi:group I intron endonuclease